MKKRKACRLQSLTDEINVYEISLANNTSKHSLYDVTDVKVERDKENSKNGRGKSVHSAPISQGGKNEIKNQRKSISKYLIERIPKEVAAQAMFCHSMSLVVVLIQFRSGRSLFPVQTTSRKRLLSVHDLVSSMTEYLQNLDYYKVKGVTFTPTYKEHMFEIMKILQSVQNTIQSSRRSADRIHLSPRF